MRIKVEFQDLKKVLAFTLQVAVMDSIEMLGLFISFYVNHRD